MIKELDIEHYAASLPSLPKPYPKTLRFASPWRKAELIEQLQKAPEGQGDGKAVCFTPRVEAKRSPPRGRKVQRRRWHQRLDCTYHALWVQDSQRVGFLARRLNHCLASTAQIILMNENLTQLQTVFELAERYGADMNRTLFAKMSPAFIGVPGAFLLHFNFATAVILNNLGIVWFTHERNNLCLVLHSKRIIH